MSASLGTTLEARIVNSLREYLAADATLGAFFGRKAIRVHWGNPLAIPVRAPYLAISPILLKDEATSLAFAKGKCPISFDIYLPPALPENPEIATPGKPAVSVANGGGALTGVYYYALTALTSDGESFVSPLSDPKTLAAGKATITIPTGGGVVWRRLWRTENGLTCPRIRAFSIPDGTTSVVDEAPDSALGDEIYPDQGLEHELAAKLKEFIEAHKCVHDSGTDLILTESIAEIEDAERKVSASRNQTIVRIKATWQVFFDRVTRQSVLE